MERNEIIQEAWTLLEPEIVEQGYELVEVELGRYGSGGLLRLFIDKEGGVTVDDCAAVSRLISAVLDKEDFLEDSYMLEVSSPGFDRPVRKPADFERFAGERIKIKTVTPIEGRKRFQGILRGYDDGLIEIDSGGATHRIHIENVDKANLDR